MYKNSSKFSGLTPSSILDLGKIVGMRRIETSVEKPLSKIGPRVLECSQISELVESLNNLKLSAMVLDHFKDMEGKAKTFREQFWKMLDNLAKTRDTKVVALGYRTSPADEDETNDLVEP